MYLPLAGYKIRDGFEEKMSINSIGPSFDPRIIQPVDSSTQANQETQSIPGENATAQPGIPGLPDEDKQAAVDSFYGEGSMSTQDFLVLRSQGTEEPFRVLDEVIANMKENMEEVGDALEAMSEMVEKSSKSNLALQLLEKTLEAMDENKAEK